MEELNKKITKYEEIQTFSFPGQKSGRLEKEPEAKAGGKSEKSANSRSKMHGKADKVLVQQVTESQTAQREVEQSAQYDRKNDEKTLANDQEMFESLKTQLQ